MINVLSALSDVFFPPLCLSCGEALCREGSAFCPSCYDGMDFITHPLCAQCGIPFASPGSEDHLCADCLTDPPPFSRARSVGRYKTVLLEAIHRFKYQRHIVAGEGLGRMMADYAFPGFTFEGYDLIMPVPLHPKRLRERGFNQSVILARELSGRFAIPLDFMSLRRHRDTSPQVGLGSKERGSNIHGAFRVAARKKVEGRRIILVDDVYTTGSTLKECARMLMADKAAEVAVLTVARAV